jgi:mRNA interferase MazF
MDFGMAAKVRPALFLTGQPAANELDLTTVLLHTTSVRGNPWELNIPKPFMKPGAFHLQQIQIVSAVRLERRLGVRTPNRMNQVRKVQGRGPAPLSQAGQPRAKPGHKPPPDIQRLEQHLLKAAHRLPDGQGHADFSRLRWSRSGRPRWR